MKQVFFLLLITIAAVGAAFAAEVSGLVYHDGDGSARSYYAQDIGSADKSLPDIDVRLLSLGDERQTATNADGAFAFGDVAPGTYFLDVGVTGDHACTSHNRSLRTPQALREGAIHIVSIGDSIGVYGSDHPYPSCLADHFSNLADVTLDNLAVTGSTSWEWLPGADTGYWDERLAPLLPETDLLTVTLGGNDYAVYLPPDGPPYDAIEILENFLANPQYFFDMIPNVQSFLEAAHAANPNMDIIYVVYPNFGNSTFMIDEIGQSLQPLASAVFGFGMRTFRWAMGQEDWVALGDMYGALGSTWLDPYMYDAIHPNDAGHQYYSDVIFQALGGVVIGDDRMGEQRMFGFDAPDLAPIDDDTADDTADDVTDDAVDDTADDTAADDTAIDDTTDDSVDDDEQDDTNVDDTAADDSAADDTAASDDAAGDDDDDSGGCGC